MSTIDDLHERAMSLADEAFFAERSGRPEIARVFNRQALELEVQAAEMLRDEITAEPSRSVLYRSAASFAVECEEFRLAEQLISKALSGEPPAEIAEELRDLLDTVNFRRHLELDRIELQPGELQLSIAGNQVGTGYTLSDLFVERVQDIERLIFRTVERLLGKDFREQGTAVKSIREGYSVYMSAPRAGSFTVTLHLGRQMQLPDIDILASVGDVIEDIVDNFQLVESGEEDRLKERIGSEAYLRNFLALAKRIAPDGDAVRTVGLTSRNPGIVKKVAIRRTRGSIEFPGSQAKSIRRGATQPQKTVTGRLLKADGTKQKGKLQLVEEDGTTHNVTVPEGMMDDIVKPLWNDVVIVTGVPYNKGILLQDIDVAHRP